jgi:aldehyde:ferredoxin oxidoreductase
LGVPFRAKVIKAVTGGRWDEERLTIAAERGWYLKRIFNFHCGAGLEKDGLPKRIQEQIKDAGVDHPDFDHALGLYWSYRQLDPKGFPLHDKLTALGLEQFSRAIEVK